MGEGGEQRDGGQDERPALQGLGGRTVKSVDPPRAGDGGRRLKGSLGRNG
jgi:hypothetical protein